MNDNKGTPQGEMKSDTVFTKGIFPKPLSVTPTGPHHVPHVPLANDPVELIKLVGDLRDAVDAINRKLDHIFGGHVVIDGRLVRIT